VICIAEGVCCPCGLIFGGTDVNECVSDPRYKDIMQQAVTNARFILLSKTLRNFCYFLEARTLSDAMPVAQSLIFLPRFVQKLRIFLKGFALRDSMHCIAYNAMWLKSMVHVYCENLPYLAVLC